MTAERERAVMRRPLVERALPREAMWFFVVAPPGLALLFDPSCVKDPPQVARALVSIGAYTILTGLAVHFSFEKLAARMRESATSLRILAHVLLVAVVVTVVTLPQLPLIMLVYPDAAGNELDILSRGIVVSLVYIGMASFIAYLQRQAVRERLRAHEEREAALEARLAVLQAQMQPHFLFNSLNVCAGLVHEDPDAAEATLDRLAGFLRYALESTERRLVTLGEELDAVRAYLEVQRARFGDRLRYEVEADEAARGWRVPPMLLQPLVENALLHGLREREDGGLVRVRARIDEAGLLAIDVEDDGVGPARSTHRGTGTGERNVRERLALVYGARAAMTTGSSEALGGYRSSLAVPLVTTKA